MKKTTVTIALLMGVLCVAQAALIASESFETTADGAGGTYDDTNLYGQTVTEGNTGFNAANAWVNNTGAVKANTALALTHNGIVSGTTDGAVLITSGYNRNSNRQLASTPPTSSCYYFSGLARCNGASVLDNGDKMAMGMMDSIAANSFDVSTGIHIGYTKAEDTVYLSAFAGGATYNLLALSGGNVGAVFQVVLKLDVNASGNETLTAWYAENGDSQLTEGLSATVVGDIWQEVGDLDTFACQTAEGGTTAAQLGRFDEMRFGTSLSDVVMTVQPADNSSTYMIHPHFRWTVDPAADRYEIQIANDSGFSSILQTDTVPVSRYVPLDPLPAGQDCWWRVRSRYMDESTGRWSDDYKLSITPFTNAYSVNSTDALSTITNTIATAVANTPSKLTFASGVYNLDMPDGTHLFDLSDVRNMEIEGNNSQINMRNPNSGFSYFSGCENILLRRFNVDYVDYLSANEEPVTHTAGTVVSVRTNDASFVFEPLPGYLPPTDVRISEASSRRWGSLMDINVPGKLKDNVSSWYDFKTQVESLGNNQYRLYLIDAHATRIKYFDDGDTFVKSASYAKYIMFSSKSTNITYELIASYAGSGNHYIGQFNDSIHFLGCASRIKEGRLVSNPCGGYVAYNWLTGFWIEDCHIEGMLDDPFNCVNKPMYVYDKISANTVRLYNVNPAPLIKTGQHLMLCTPATGIVEGPFEVSAVSYSSNLWSVTVNDDIGDIAPGQGSYDSQLFIEEQNHPYAYVRNSTFQNSRGCGVFRSTGGVVESNDFVNLAGLALVMKYYIGGGWNVSDVRIDGNYIKGCGYDALMIAQNLATIDLEVDAAPGTNCTAMTHRNIEICGNTIVRQRKGVSVANTQDLLFAGNTFINVDEPVVVDAESTSNIVVALNDIIVDNDQNTNTYSETVGVWQTSGLTGWDGGTTRYSNSAGAAADWIPDFPVSGQYEVYIYKVVYANSDTNACITVSHSGGDTVQYIDYRQGVSEWVYLGTYSFEQGVSGGVRNTRTSTNCRADAVLFRQKL